MKLFGHPIHLMLVHFPSALFPADFLFSLAAKFTDFPFLLHAAFYALVAGTLSGWLAVISGALDIRNVMRNKPSSLKRALLHGSLNSCVLLAYTGIALAGIKGFPDTLNNSALLLLTKGILVSLMIAANFAGGMLVLKDKVLDEKNS